MSEVVGFGSNKLIVSVPSCESPTTVEWATNIIGQYWPMNISVEYSSQDGKGEDPDILRNYVAGYALATKARYIWFLKNDVLPPIWTIHRLLEAMKQDKSIMVCAAMSPTNVPETTDFSECLKIFKDNEGKEFELLQVASNQYVNLECTLVKTEVFNIIDEPWFKSTELVSSASNFCYKVIQAGYKVCAHSGVICGDIDMQTGKPHWPADAIASIKDNQCA